MNTDNTEEFEVFSVRFSARTGFGIYNSDLNFIGVHLCTSVAKLNFRG